MIRRLLVSLFFCCVIGMAFGQSDGDYRSDQYGNWSSPSTWQVYYDGDWRSLESVAAGPFRNVIPSSTSGVITIRNGVNVDVNATANQVVINQTLTIYAGRTLTIQGDGINTPLLINPSTPSALGRLVNNGVLDLQTQIGTVPCQILGTLTSNGTILTSSPSLLQFAAGSQYIHLNNTGGDVPLATWDINSTCVISGLTKSKPSPPGNLGQAFGNFEWNTPSIGYSNNFHLGGALQNVQGNLTFVTTGGTTVRLKYTGGGSNLTVGGNLVIEGGDVILTQSLSGASTITVGGNLLISGGTFRLGNNNSSAVNLWLNGNFIKTGGTLLHSGSSGLGIIRFDGGVQTYNNNSAINSPVSFSVQNGSTLDLRNATLTGSGSFTLFSGGTIILGSADPAGALQLGNSGGNIRLTGTRTYQTGSTIIYDGNGAQYLGNGHPSAPHTIISNGVGATMVSDVTINGDLTIGDTDLIIGNNKLTLGGDLIRVGGALGVSTGSSVTINGSGDFGDLVFYFTEYADNPIKDLTINRSEGTVYLGSSLVVGGNFVLQNGNLSLGQYSAYTLTLRGNFSQSNLATLSVYDNSRLVIEGSGTLPANVRITGPNLFELTMDRPSSTFNSTSALTLTNLNLYNGTVNNSALNIVMADGGTVTRRSGGSITSVLGVIKDDEGNGSFDVIYDVTGDITTGNELPYTDEAGITRLRNLRKTGSATVNLNHPIQVNGDFEIEEGAFHLGSGNHVAITGNLDVDGQLLTTQSRLSFIGSSSQSIDAVSKLELYDFEVNQSAGSTVTLGPTTLIDISTRLAVLSSGSTLQAGTNQLTLLSTPQGTANVAPVAAGAAINGSVIVQRYLPKAVQRAEYYHLASPVTNATFAEWNDDVNIKRVDQWHESTAKYGKVPLSAPIVNGKGYVVDISTVPATTIQLDGSLRYGNVSVPVTTQTPGVESGDYGWNLIGNPYPSAISWDNVAIDDSQVYDAIYMWDNFGNSGQGTGIGIGVSYVDGVGTPADYEGQIAQGQAFWVKALQNTSIQFTENAKIPETTTTVYRQKEIPNVLRIVINGNGVKDEAVVRLRDGATENFDGRFDAYKFRPTGFNISTLTGDNVKAAINAFGPSSCNSNIPLIAEGAKVGSFTLDFSGLESFDPSVSITLIDLVAEKRIDIKDSQSYAFVITDENLGLTERRFELSIGSNLAQINTAILAKGDAVCEDQEFAKIILDDSEPGIEYVAEFNGTKLSDPVTGTGSAIELLIRSSALTTGENKIKVMASAGTCSMTALTVQPVVTRFEKGRIRDVTPGEICGAGSATLQVSGATTEGWYAWYESSEALEPIEGQSDATFTTPHLSKSKTYYVAAVNALGCEGVRVPVKAVITFPEQVALTSDSDGNLVSSVAEGIKWYYNDVLLENETSAILTPFESGVYTVEVTNGGCKTTAEMEVTGLGEAGIVIYPNPTADKVWVRVRTSNNNVNAALVNSQGVEIARKELVGKGDIKEAEMDLLNYAPGMYHIRIHDGNRVINRKIAKVD